MRTILLSLLASSAVSLAQQPVFKSHRVTTETPGHAVSFNVEMKGAKSLWLVVTDGGDGFACDWADWAEVSVSGSFGEKKITELEWKSASSDWGKVRKNANAGGDAMRIAGQAVSFGIGAHANSVIEFELPPGTARIKGRAGLDEGGTRQGHGGTVEFAIYTKKPVIKSGGQRAGGLEPAEALTALDVHPALEAKLFASEPMLLSPSAMDVDHRGRVWVCEVVNYRAHRGKRPEGDRILILEDANGDGVADKQTVFYQGQEVDSAHGVCVLGNQVIVSAGSQVLRFTDDNGDDRADRTEVMFSGISGAQHDHGIHAFSYGPDGRLYFNFGNSGVGIKDKDGKPLRDKAGNEPAVAPANNPYREGMVFRCEMDGSGIETLGWNFRNNWEVAADSFGTLWQSDNDDDGNKGVRINYVMEFGNYGYKDEITGAGWQTPRTNLESEIPLRHWHLNDPGVVPNLLQTGAGSPTGICIYEGELLPAVFRNQMIHCDAGPNVVRAYPVKPKGAGYEAEIVNILQGARDKWFRPSDVAVAPDGSLLVADWYDPGVGGHGMGDLGRGRIFRVAPKGARWSVPKHDFGYAESAARALTSPNSATRHLAWKALRAMASKAEPELVKLWQSPNARHRARALWLLGRLDAAKWVTTAIADKDADIRITGVRLARQLGVDLNPVLAKLRNDASPQVRRECAIALRHSKLPGAAEHWAALAAKHEAGDRWSLEALGIGADKHWDAYLPAWLESAGETRKSPGGREIIWRSRAQRTPELLAEIASASTDEKEQLSLMRAFDFQPASEGKDKALRALAASGRDVLVIEAIQRLGSFDYAKADDKTQNAIQGYLAKHLGSQEYFEFVRRFRVTEEMDHLLQLALTKSAATEGIEAMRCLLLLCKEEDIVKNITEQDKRLLKPLGALGLRQSAALLGSFFEKADARPALLAAVAEAMTRSREGAVLLVKLVSGKKVPEALRADIGRQLAASPDAMIRSEAAKHFGVTAATGAKLPPVNDLVKRRDGDAARGHAVYQRACMVCHQIGQEGIMFGPALSEIGTKLPKDAIYAAILEPNAAVTMGFEGWEVRQRDGSVMLGLVTSETQQDITLRIIGGVDNKIAKSAIAQRKKLEMSLMPPGLHAAMTEQELVDLVEFLSAQVKK